MESSKLVRQSLAKSRQNTKQSSNQAKTWRFITIRPYNPLVFYRFSNLDLKQKIRSIAERHYTKAAMADRTRIAPESDGLNITTL